MIEVSFRSDLYSGFAVDSAVKVYGDYASFEVEEKDGQYVVRLTAAGDFDESVVADELANYALGTTIEQHRSEMG